MCGHHAVIACPKKPYRLPDTGPDLLLCVESVTSTSTVHHQGYQSYIMVLVSVAIAAVLARAHNP